MAAQQLRIILEVPQNPLIPSPLIPSPLIPSYNFILIFPLIPDWKSHILQRIP